MKIYVIQNTVSSCDGCDDYDINYLWSVDDKYSLQELDDMFKELYEKVKEYTQLFYNLRNNYLVFSTFIQPYSLIFNEKIKEYHRYGKIIWNDNSYEYKHGDFIGINRVNIDCDIFNLKGDIND